MWLLATLAAANPVAVTQAWTFYVDGQMASVVTLLLLLMGMIYLKLPGQKAQWLTLIFAFIIVCNIKFTGMVFAGIIGVVFLALLLASRRAHDAMRLVVLGILAAAVAIFLVGFHPYLQNLRDHQNPFYPLWGGGYDILSYNANRDFLGFNRINKILISWFSRSSNSETDLPLLKWPFSVDRREVDLFGYCDVRFGGFGPVFSGILVLALVAMILSAVDTIKNKPSNPQQLAWETGIRRWSWATMGCIALSLLILPEAWWARPTCIYTIQRKFGIRAGTSIGTREDLSTRQLIAPMTQATAGSGKWTMWRAVPC